MPPAKVSANASLGSIQPASAASPPHAALERARVVAVAFGDSGSDASDDSPGDSSDVSSGSDGGGASAAGSELPYIFVALGTPIGMLAVMLHWRVRKLQPSV